MLASMQNFINCRSPNKPHAAGNSCCRKIDTICTLCIKHRNSIFLLLVATVCVRCARTQPSTTLSISKICDLLYFPIFIFIIRLLFLSILSNMYLLLLIWLHVIPIFDFIVIDSRSCPVRMNHPLYYLM